MKAGWKSQLLGEVCTFENGDRGTNYPSKAVRTSTGVPFINAGHLTDKGIDIDNLDFIPRERFDLLNSGKIRKGDILFCLRGSLGKFASVGDLVEGAIASSLVIIRPNKQVMNEYILAYLECDVCASMIERFRNGTAQPNLGAQSLNKFEIPIPPLPEQQRIVDILDEAFAGIAVAKANAQKNLQNARALFESHLQAVFSQRGEGWVEVRIEDVCESVIDCVNKTAPTVDYPTHFKMIRTTNVRNGSVNLDSVKYVTEDTYRIWTRRQVPQFGDIVLTREAPLGEVGMLLSDDKVFLGQRLVLYRVNPTKLDNSFLLYAFQSTDLKSQIYALASGSTVQHMRVPDSKNLKLFLPSMGEQNSIVAVLNALKMQTQRLETIYQQKLAALDELKRSLLHKAFSGEL